jgi:hypothetical protein
MRDLHGENRSKAGFALDNALIGFGSFVELVSFRDDFYLAFSDKVESFVEEFGPVLRAPKLTSAFLRADWMWAIGSTT